MAIYIKGVELPKDDDYMILTVYSDGVVYLRQCKGELCLEDSTNATDIPEPHGRLIDVDALEEYHCKHCVYAIAESCNMYPCYYLHNLQEERTVIERSDR